MHTSLVRPRGSGPRTVKCPTMVTKMAGAKKTYINSVSTSLLKSTKVPWPPFPFSTRMYKIENAKQEKDEVNVLSSFKFREVKF